MCQEAGGVDDYTPRMLAPPSKTEMLRGPCICSHSKIMHGAFMCLDQSRFNMNIAGKTGQAASSNPRKLLKAAKSYVLPQSRGVLVPACELVQYNKVHWCASQVLSDVDT